MSNPRQAKYTIFIYCEGKTDCLFVKYLHRLYHCRGQSKITFKEGTGGGFSTFISDVVKNAQIRDYDEKYILLDVDNKSEQEQKRAEKSSQEKNIQLIWQKPCLEGVFLQILGQRVYGTSKECKSFFYKEYKVKDSKLTEALLCQFFSKTLLNLKRKEIKSLNLLIKLMEKIDSKI